MDWLSFLVSCAGFWLKKFYAPKMFWHFLHDNTFRFLSGKHWFLYEYVYIETLKNGLFFLAKQYPGIYLVKSQKVDLTLKIHYLFEYNRPSKVQYNRVRQVASFRSAQNPNNRALFASCHPPLIRLFLVRRHTPKCREPSSKFCRYL